MDRIISMQKTASKLHKLAGDRDTAPSWLMETMFGKEPDDTIQAPKPPPNPEGKPTFFGIPAETTVQGIPTTLNNAGTVGNSPIYRSLFWNPNLSEEQNQLDFNLSNARRFAARRAGLLRVAEKVEDFIEWDDYAFPSANNKKPKRYRIS